MTNSLVEKWPRASVLIRISINVPHGSILGCLLLTIYINIIISASPQCNFKQIVSYSGQCKSCWILQIQYLGFWLDNFSDSLLRPMWNAWQADSKSILDFCTETNPLSCLLVRRVCSGLRWDCIYTFASPSTLMPLGSAYPSALSLNKILIKKGNRIPPPPLCLM